MKKITFILLLALMPTYNTFADQVQPTHSLGFGIGYNWGTGFLFSKNINGIDSYVNLQSQWNNPWVAMINHFEYTYYFIDSKATNSVNYSIGARIFLGVPSVFFDTYVGMAFITGKYFLIMPQVGLSLGFNIPITERIKLQVIINTEYEMAIFDLQGNIGVQFTL